MEAQVQQLIDNLNGKQPTRADVIELLDLIYDEPQPDKDNWIAFYANATEPKIIEDIKSYPNYEKPEGIPAE